MFFSVITKNLNWQILTKNLVTFKRDGVRLRMKSFSIMGFIEKSWFLRDGSQEINIYGGITLNKGA